MSGGREALQMRFHFGERDRDGGRPLHAAVMDACVRRGVWAAALGEEVIATPAEGLMALEEVERVPTGAATTTAAMAAAPVGGVPGDVVRATLWGPRTGAGSPHLRAVEALYRHGAESATVLLGVDGVLDGERRRARFLAANRGVPGMTVAVGEREVIVEALAELGSLPNLVTFEGVERNRPNEAEKLHSGSGAVHCSRIPRAALHGARVALLTSEATHGEAHPLYLEFIHALRRGGAPGATALRGVWGFRGDDAPHGDRVLALRRDVPLLVETVDSVERSAAWLAVAESLAGGSDLVHCQRVGRRFVLD